MIPQELIVELLLIHAKVLRENIHGTGYVPMELSKVLEKFSSTTKNLQQKFPKFNCCINCPEEDTVYIDYDGIEYRFNFYEELKKFVGS